MRHSQSVTKRFLARVTALVKHVWQSPRPQQDARDGGALLRAHDAVTAAELRLSSAVELHKAARTAVITGDYRTIDHNGDPITPKQERTRLLGVLGGLAVEQGDALLELDTATSVAAKLEQLASKHAS